ncbi:MAG TPA: PEP-CTERM sorting domain-containing protein [Pyrinomonadaceae bacterium]|jgi:hypothetical protein
MRISKLAVFFVLLLVLITVTPAKADPLTFSDVTALQNFGFTSVPLFFNSGAVLLTQFDPSTKSEIVIFDAHIKGTLPVGATNILRFTLAQGNSIVIKEFIVPPQGISNPIDYITGAVFEFPNAPHQLLDGSVPANTLFTLTVDLIGSNPDFVIPGGPNAGQMVDSYTYSFYVVKPIPEPATLLLLGTGLAGVAAGVMKRRKGHEEGET